MDQGESRQAVEGPARKVGLTFEPGLVKRILDDLGDEPGHLPLLEFALTELWSRQEDGRLTHAAYDEIGRAQGALAWRAETVYASLSTDERARVQRIFVQLVCPGEGTEDTRRRATQMELGDAAWPLVQRLADERLVTTGRDRASGQPTVEVAHEALIRSWTRLRAWVEADRAFRTWQERLRAALRQWGATDKDEGALLRGAPLAEAKSWLVERGPDLGEEECAFIQTSLAEEKQRQQRELEQEREQRRKLLEKEAMVRHKLARDLHDGPTQTISAIAMRLNFIQMMFQKKQPADKIVEEVVKIEELARKTTREVRTMLFTLRPVVLETQGLAKALEQYADRLCQTEGLNVEVDPDGYDGQLSKQAESVVFAVVEEAVGNAKKHAKADHVLVRLRIESHLFTAEIQDDGIGFDVETAQRRREAGHMGLLNMEERAELVGGRCSIQSQPGAGTSVRLDIPLRRWSDAE
jgi:signal transduction histidine kinase